MTDMKQTRRINEGAIAATKLLCSIGTCATALDLSDSGVRRLMAAGDLPSVQIGHRRLVPHEALLAYVERLKANASDGPEAA